MVQHGRRQEQDNNLSYTTSLLRWLELKNYQYEVTFSLYMLTRTEKIVFNMILFVLASMMIIAIALYLPNHVSIIYKRVWYYVQGSNVTSTLAEAVKTTKAALAYSTATPVVTVTERVVREL